MACRATRERRLIGASILALGLAVAGCGGSPPPPSSQVEAVADARQTGVASYYAHKFHGRTTASGETYDMYAMTAAHRTLPFGARVLVTHLENGKRVELRINDRGPFIKGRIIDVSYRAAQDLDMIRSGVAEVRVEVVSVPPGTP